MFRASMITVTAGALLLIAGCSASKKPATLTIHAHDGIYDLIGHEGSLIETVNALNELEATLKKKEIVKLIRGNRVILRFEGVRTANGLSVPEELTPLLAKLVAAGIMEQEIEYTND